MQEDSRLDMEVNERGKQAGEFLKAAGEKKVCTKKVHDIVCTSVPIYTSERWMKGAKYRLLEMRFLWGSVGVSRGDRIRYNQGRSWGNTTHRVDSKEYTKPNYDSLDILK